MSNKAPHTPWPILIADDDEDDLMFITSALRAAGVREPIETFSDGDELVRYLLESQGKVRPALIISDMNMPRASGKDVLIAIKNDPAYKSTPFLILSTSRNEKEIRHCYELGADSFLTKPSNLAELEVVAKGIKALWLDGNAEAGELSDTA